METNSSQEALLRKFVEAVDIEHLRQNSTPDPPRWSQIRTLVIQVKKFTNTVITGLVQREIFIECLLKYIELVMTFISSQDLFDYKRQIQYLDRCFGSISMIVEEKDFKNLFIQKATDKVLDIFFYDNFNFLCKKALLKAFNDIAQNSDKEVRIETANQKLYHLYRLLDCLYTHGDFSIQADIMETMFRIFGAQIRNNSLEYRLLPGSDELDMALKNDISCEHFDNDVRKWLNKFNKNSEYVFSIACNKIMFGELVCPPPEDLDTMWIDFNLQNKMFTFYCNSNSEDTWNRITVLSNYVKTTEVKRPLGGDKTVISMHLLKPCISDHLGSQDFFDKLDKHLKLIFTNEEKDGINKLVTVVLPQLFKENFSHSSSKISIKPKQLYRPLSIKVSTSRKSFTSDVSSITTTSKGQSISEVIPDLVAPRLVSEYCSKNLNRSEIRSESNTNFTTDNISLDSSNTSEVLNVTSEPPKKYVNVGTLKQPKLQDNVITSSHDYSDISNSNSHSIEILSRKCSGVSVDHNALEMVRNIEFHPSEVLSSSPVKVSKNIDKYSDDSYLSAIDSVSTDAPVEVVKTSKFRMPDDELEEVFETALEDLQTGYAAMKERLKDSMKVSVFLCTTEEEKKDTAKDTDDQESLKESKKVSVFKDKSAVEEEKKDKGAVADKKIKSDKPKDNSKKALLSKSKTINKNIEIKATKPSCIIDLSQSEGVDAIPPEDVKTVKATKKSGSKTSKKAIAKAKDFQKLNKDLNTSSQSKQTKNSRPDDVQIVNETVKSGFEKLKSSKKKIEESDISYIENTSNSYFNTVKDDQKISGKDSHSISPSKAIKNICSDIKTANEFIKTGFKTSKHSKKKDEDLEETSCSNEVENIAVEESTIDKSKEIKNHPYSVKKPNANGCGDKNISNKDLKIVRQDQRVAAKNLNDIEQSEKNKEQKSYFKEIEHSHIRKNADETKDPVDIVQSQEENQYNESADIFTQITQEDTRNVSNFNKEESDDNNSSLYSQVTQTTRINKMGNIGRQVNQGQDLIDASLAVNIGISETESEDVIRIEEEILKQSNSVVKTCVKDSRLKLVRLMKKINRKDVMGEKDSQNAKEKVNVQNWLCKRDIEENKENIIDLTLADGDGEKNIVENDKSNQSITNKNRDIDKNATEWTLQDDFSQTNQKENKLNTPELMNILGGESPVAKKEVVKNQNQPKLKKPVRNIIKKRNYINTGKKIFSLENDVNKNKKQDLIKDQKENNENIVIVKNSENKVVEIEKNNVKHDKNMNMEKVNEIFREQKKNDIFEGTEKITAAIEGTASKEDLVPQTNVKDIDACDKLSDEEEFLGFLRRKGARPLLTQESDEQDDNNGDSENDKDPKNLYNKISTASHSSSTNVIDINSAGVVIRQPVILLEKIKVNSTNSDSKDTDSEEDLGAEINCENVNYIKMFDKLNSEKKNHDVALEKHVKAVITGVLEIRNDSKEGIEEVNKSKSNNMLSALSVVENLENQVKSQEEINTIDQNEKIFKEKNDEQPEFAQDGESVQKKDQLSENNAKKQIIKSSLKSCVDEPTKEKFKKVSRLQTKRNAGGKLKSKNLSLTIKKVTDTKNMVKTEAFTPTSTQVFVDVCEIGTYNLAKSITYQNVKNNIKQQEDVRCDITHNIQDLSKPVHSQPTTPTKNIEFGPKKSGKNDSSPEDVNTGQNTIVTVADIHYLENINMCNEDKGELEVRKSKLLQKITTTTGNENANQNDDILKDKNELTIRKSKRLFEKKSRSLETSQDLKQLEKSFKEHFHTSKEKTTCQPKRKTPPADDWDGIDLDDIISKTNKGDVNMNNFDKLLAEKVLSKPTTTSLNKSKTNTTIGSKGGRKLFNPGDLSYLDNMPGIHEHIESSDGMSIAVERAAKIDRKKKTPAKKTKVTENNIKSKKTTATRLNQMKTTKRKSLEKKKQFSMSTTKFYDLDQLCDMSVSFLDKKKFALESTYNHYNRPSLHTHDILVRKAPHASSSESSPEYLRSTSNRIRGSPKLPKDLEPLETPSSGKFSWPELEIEGPQKKNVPFKKIKILQNITIMPKRPLEEINPEPENPNPKKKKMDEDIMQDYNISLPNIENFGQNEIEAAIPKEVTKINGDRGSKEVITREDMESTMKFVIFLLNLLMKSDAYSVQKLRSIIEFIKRLNS